ncbi:MAG: MCE family protein [Ignavibacteria bacterium]|nr:MCE family protein [Ignavibacteria bacterium]
MKSNKNLELKVGLLSIAAIILLVVGITLVKGISVSISQNVIRLRFEQSAGIQESAPVTINGVKRGSVTKVENDNGSVLISANLSDISDIKEDAFAKITMLEITGGKKIEIFPGKSESKFNFQNELPGVQADDLSNLISDFGTIAKQTQSVMGRIDSLTFHLTNSIANNQSFEKLNSSLDNIVGIIELLQNQAQRTSGDIDYLFKDLNYLSSNIKKTYVDYAPIIDSLLSRLDRISADAETILHTTKSSIASVDNLLIDIKDITSDLKTGDGVLSRLIYDNKLSLKVDSTINSLNLLMKHIKNYGINANIRLGTRP